MGLKRINGVLALVLFYACTSAQHKFFNNEYYPRETTSISCVMLPVQSDNKQLECSKYDEILRLETSNFSSIPSQYISEKVVQDEQLNLILRKIYSASYSNNELREFPNFFGLLSEYELEYLRWSMPENDLLLAPILFNIYESHNANILKASGSVVFRLYDLNTGDFIFEYRDGPVTRTKESEVFILMLSEFRDYLKANVIDRFGIY